MNSRSPRYLRFVKVFAWLVPFVFAIVTLGQDMKIPIMEEIDGPAIPAVKGIDEPITNWGFANSDFIRRGQGIRVR